MTLQQSGLFFFSLCLIALPACVPIVKIPIKSRTTQPLITVAIFKGKDYVEISGKNLKLLVGREEKMIGNGKVIIVNRADGFLWKERIFKAKKIVLKGNKISVNKIRFDGDIVLIREKRGLTVINRLAMEEYLYGVIYNEVPSSWPIEAVKAQAVSSRSYALYKLNQKLDKPFLLESTVMDQVYTGRASEDLRVRFAVDETKGEVLFFESALAQALFHSNCGGHTESAENVWGRDYAHLKGVEDKFCTEAPNYFWTYRLSYDSISTALVRDGYLIDSPGKVSIVERGETGRVTTFKVGGFILSGEDLRRLIGYDKIRSTLFDVDMKGDQVTFSGSGFGHGVGMCQWGAKGMAQAGASYKDILKKYYQGVVVKKVY